MVNPSFWNRDTKIILSFSLFFMLLVCGCTINNLPGTKISDNDLSLQILNDYIFAGEIHLTSPATPLPQEQKAEREASVVKNRSITFYNRVSPLKVLSEPEYSKASFLQSLKESEEYSDSLVGRDFSTYTIITQTKTGATYQFDPENHNRNRWHFFIKAPDSNVCSATSDKFANLTVIYNQLSNLTEYEKITGLT